MYALTIDPTQNLGESARLETANPATVDWVAAELVLDRSAITSVVALNRVDYTFNDLQDQWEQGGGALVVRITLLGRGEAPATVQEHTIDEHDRGGFSEDLITVLGKSAITNQDHGFQIIGQNFPSLHTARK